MDKYLSAQTTIRSFVMFSSIHWITLGVITLANAVFIFWFKRLAGSKSVNAANTFRYWFAGIIFFNQVFFMVWCIYTGAWSLDYSLPLQLCDAIIFLSVIMLVWNNYLSFEIVYFWGFGGGLQALLTPNLAYAFPHILFFNFFLSHGAMPVAIFFMLIVKGFRPTYKSVFRVFVITNAYAAFVAAVDYFTGGNYMFLKAKPENGSIMDLLGPWPWYILSLEGVCIVVFIICYLPFAVTDFRKFKQHGKYLDS